MKKKRMRFGIAILGLLLMLGGCSDASRLANQEESGTFEAGIGQEETESAAQSEKQGESEPEKESGSGMENAEGKESREEQAAKAERPNADTGEGEVKQLAEGDIAPDFTAQLVDGTEFKLSDHDDGVVILNFFATWCGPCVKEMPAFGMLQENDYEELSILCVNCMETKKTVDAFVEQKGYTFPIAYDEEGRIEKYYPTDGIPYTLVINKGVIQKIYLGARDALTQYNAYKAAIDACLSE